MKRLIAIISAFLCILTLTACRSDKPSTESGSPAKGNVTTASVKITLENGGENSVWEEATGGAADIKQWISGFETEPAAEAPEGGLYYTITLKFGIGEPTDCRYADCGEDGCYLFSDGGWLSVKNPSPMPIGYVRELGIDTSELVKAEYSCGAGTSELNLSEDEKEAFSKWIGGIKYEHRWFPKGEAPGDKEGGEAYTLTFSDKTLSYVMDGSSEHYLLFNGEWYGVSNPSSPPLIVCF